MSTTTNVDSLKINILTKEQYDGATKDINQIYLVTDDGYDAVTTSTNGLMIASDKAKLDGIESGANKITVDNALSSTSTNPVQNKAVNTAIINLNNLVGDTSVSTQINNAVSNKVDKVSGKDLSTNDYTTDEKNKLSGIAAGAEVNQNAFSNIKVASTTLAADSKTDTFTLAAGDNVTLTTDATNTKVTIAATSATPSSTTPKVAGTAAVGSETTYARGDHVHPAQTTVSGNAGTATKLANARTIRTNLASTSTASFDGSANITPGVTGTLPIANGGTNGTTAAAAVSNLGLDNAKTVGDGSADYVIEQRSSGIWTYRKWKSGIIECWGRNTLSVTINVANGNIYTTSNYTLSLPSVGFSSLIHYEMSVGNMTCWIAGITGSTSKLTYRIASGSSTSGDMTITAYVMGKSK